MSNELSMHCKGQRRSIWRSQNLTVIPRYSTLEVDVTEAVGMLSIRFDYLASPGYAVEPIGVFLPPTYGERPELMMLSLTLKEVVDCDGSVFLV
jgi:hypothetical protein